MQAPGERRQTLQRLQGRKHVEGRSMCTFYRAVGPVDALGPGMGAAPVYRMSGVHAMMARSAHVHVYGKREVLLLLLSFTSVKRAHKRYQLRHYNTVTWAVHGQHIQTSTVVAYDADILLTIVLLCRVKHNSTTNRIVELRHRF